MLPQLHRNYNGLGGSGKDATTDRKTSRSPAIGGEYERPPTASREKGGARGMCGVGVEGGGGEDGAWRSGVGEANADRADFEQI